MDIKQLNEKLEKLLEDYGEDAELSWADEYEEIGGSYFDTMYYLCKIGNKYCIATVGYAESGEADWCDRSKLFNSKEECLDFYTTEYKEED